jgi:hypothetical protein
MMVMKYEKPQAKNPHSLTIKQHVLPARSITRFSGIDGKVSVRIKGREKDLILPPDDDLFCAKRAWDERAEHGYMKQIEDEFQKLADKLLNGTHSIDSSSNLTISRFHTLIRLRADVRASPLSDVELKGIQGENLTKDQEEILEKKWVLFSRTDSEVPGRQMAGLQIQILLDRICSLDFTWGTVISTDVDFLVPDTFGDILIVPLSPQCCLVANSPSGEITRECAIEVNRIAISKSLNYILAHDFAKCGIG